jgi:predicted Zn-dependent protease
MILIARKMIKYKVLVIVLLYALQGFSQKDDGVSYDFSCFETDATSEGISALSDIEQALLGNYGVEVSVADEMIFGKEFYTDCIKKFSVVNEGKDVQRLNAILTKLTSKIRSPRGISYTITLVDTNMLNAFTTGGYIFVTTEMLKFCVNDDELACIIGHEIAHNELGHINDHIKRFKTAQAYLGGGLGDFSAYMGSILATPLNQKDEAHCDMLGIDLAIASGYKVCSCIALWKRMQEEEGEYNQMLTILSSHPYSGKRAECAKTHISTNYSIACP